MELTHFYTIKAQTTCQIRWKRYIRGSVIVVIVDGRGWPCSQILAVNV